MISKGRFILGMGTGYLKTVLRSASTRRAQRALRRALDVLPLHWAAVQLQGKHFNPATSSLGRRRAGFDRWIGALKITVAYDALRVNADDGPPEMATTTAPRTSRASTRSAPRSQARGDGRRPRSRRR
jgi:hypothetical protein